MDAPQIQYVQTKDGVNIAFSTQGDGPAIVRMSNVPWSHFQLQWEKMPERRAFVRSMAERFTYVDYDFRGAGSSTREVAGFSLDAHILDLEAVVDHLELETFALIAIINSGPLAIAYVARNPQRISRLVLVNSYARYSDVLATPEARRLRR